MIKKRVEFNKWLSVIIGYLRLDFLVAIFLKRKIFIINYHGVGRLTDANRCYGNLLVDPQLFEQELAYLKKMGHTFINFSDLASFSTQKLLSLNKPTLIYFDDGLADLAVDAFPLLKKYGAKATVFVCPELADGQEILWTIKYRQFLLTQNMAESEIESSIKRAKKMPQVDRQKMLTDLYAQHNFIFDGGGLFLTWQQLRDLSGRYEIEIGSHSFSHRQLIDCSTHDLHREIVESKKIIEENIPVSVMAFSYPYGRYNEMVLDQVASASYRVAVSGGQGVNDVSDLLNNRLRLKNIPARISDNLAMFSGRLYFSNLFRR